MYYEDEDDAPRHYNGTFQKGDTLFRMLGKVYPGQAQYYFVCGVERMMSLSSSEQDMRRGRSVISVSYDDEFTIARMHLTERII